ncbi:MAG: sterol desaturase family protein, partial [Gammaproteobacteria bacterium]|nr:sterol desaturase family protein [Gammaproteobacteria bacterium]
MTLIYSTYIPVLLAALSIILLEHVFPYRTAWKPSRAEVVNDSTFMVVVQVALPQILSLIIVLELSAATTLGQTIWPRELPDGVQVVLMVLIADFLRYWLHRASHGWSPLWQLHAVHHSPHKLYWLNVGRFHPLEKAVQFLFDAMPFILLGVEETVLSLYFVFYAVNGYFQHCNINLKMGWLNFLISSAELHRWHHSVDNTEANRNYGNNIIIWDLLFGTYFLPHNAQVGELGLKNRNYATRFVDQIKTPFIPHMENTGLPMISYKEIVINLILKMRFLILYLSGW